MGDRADLLRQAMLTTQTSQTDLARMSGVHQPSISQFLSGAVTMSDSQLDRLLSCMGLRLEVVRRVTAPQMSRSERRSWLLHRSLARRLTAVTLEAWRPTINRNLEHRRSGVTGQPHERNLERWQTLMTAGDIGGLKRVMTGLDRESVEMREVSPLGGILTENERRDALAEVS